MLWLVGSGSIALEYAKVLKELKVNYFVIGRGKQSAQRFNSITKTDVFIGGLSKFLRTKPQIPKKVINCVSIEQLQSTSLELLKYGVKNILLEKPGGCSIQEINELNKNSKKRRLHICLRTRRY